MNWLTYLLVGLIVAHNDAILCFAMKRRFRMWPSLLTGACWPVVIPVAIIGAYVLTRNFPRVGAAQAEQCVYFGERAGE